MQDRKYQRKKHFDREDMVIVGTPDECFEKLLKYEEAGVDQVLCYLNFGYLPHEAVLRSIELLGTEVIPRLKAHRADRIAEGLTTAIENYRSLSAGPGE